MATYYHANGHTLPITVLRYHPPALINLTLTLEKLLTTIPPERLSAISGHASLRLPERPSYPNPGSKSESPEIAHICPQTHPPISPAISASSTRQTPQQRTQAITTPHLRQPGVPFEIKGLRVKFPMLTHGHKSANAMAMFSFSIDKNAFHTYAFHVGNQRTVAEAGEFWREREGEEAFGCKTI